MYAELHAHSNFSLLDGASHIEDLVDRAAQLGMPAIAMTDHDGLYVAARFFKAAAAAGIKPVAGAELTLVGGFHVVLLAENPKGYANLCRLITKAHLAGSKGDPRLSFDDLAGWIEGLICLSGCLRGEIPSLLRAAKRHEAAAAARRYLDLFGPGRFYIELQSHFTPEGRRLCNGLRDLAAALRIGVVATNNVHYALRDDGRLNDVLVCIKNRVTLDSSARYRRPNREFYLKGEEEMAALPGITRESLEQTMEVAGRCRWELDFSSSFPDYPLPDGEEALPFLRRLALQQAKRRYGELNEAIRARLDHELDLIGMKGLAGYFLVVWDIMEYARSIGVSAQGRGSAASSVVAHVLGITPVDPLKHNLFVGRFLNEFAIPDIDIDIATHRREEVIQYVYGKYGAEHAAMVCTYVTFQARNAIRETGKVLGLPPHLLDRMAKSISSYGGARAIETLRETVEFKNYLNSLPWKDFCELCVKIADFPRHLSIHVGGMIVASRPIWEMVPLERARAEGRVVCQWDKDSIDDAGLIKVDLLGLRMLSLIDEARDLARTNRGIGIDFDSLPDDDPEVYRLIAAADTVGVFQVESRAQMQTLPKVRPRSIEDLTIEVAIIRPGPLQGNMVHPFIRRRQGIEPVAHLHPLLTPILGETLGVILFQEQILQVACAIAGFTAGEANNLRKAMGRKKAARELAKWYGRFVEGARARGVDGETATKIFNHIGGFAEFGFCKSHAASFAILCYRSAYLKRYFPVEFYCALLNNQPMGFYIPEVIAGDARRHGVTILPADINASRWNCTVEGADLRIGLRYVKGMGEEKAGRIVEERGRGPFMSLRDFWGRTSPDRGLLRNLIAAGAFGGLKQSRRQLLWEAGTLETTGFRGIGSLREGEEVPLDEMDFLEETVTDYRVQGFSPSHHLMKPLRPMLTRLGATTSGALAGIGSGRSVTVGGYRVCLQVPPTAKGFAFITLEDEEGLMNVILKPEVYREKRVLVRLEPLLLVEGVLEKKEGIINIMARQLRNLGDVEGRGD